MSKENLPQLFNEYVRKLHSRLAEVDEKYGDGNNDAKKCAEQVEIYKGFIDGLISNGEHCLGVIKTLTERLDESTFDVSSEASHIDDRVYGDLEFLRRCLDNRVGCEEKAISSLADLEATMYSILKENERLKEENRILQEQKQSVKEMVGPFEEEAVIEIQRLKKEKEELMQAVERCQKQMQGTSEDSIEPTLSSVRVKLITSKSEISLSESSDSSEPTINESPDTPPPSTQSNCEEELADVREMLASKDKTIRSLLEQINDLKKAKESNKPGGKNIRRSQSDIGRPDRPLDTTSLTDSETRDHDTLKTLEKGYKELAQILKEKYDQLRAQRAKIDELKKKLENCSAQGQELLDLKDEMAKLRNRNKQHEEDLKKLEECGATLEEIKKQAAKYNAEIETLKEREKILARKITIQEDQVEELLSERQNLLRINNEMLNSIAVCQTELCKYNIE